MSWAVLVQSFTLRCAHDQACPPSTTAGAGWTLLSEEATDSCYVVKDLPRGASYVFRVGCITKSGTGPFSDSSAPVVMATDPEGERHKRLLHQAGNLLLCFYQFCRKSNSLIPSICFLFSETRIPLIQTESLGSKGIGSDHQTQKNYSFLSEINRLVRGEFYPLVSICAPLCRAIQLSPVRLSGVVSASSPCAGMLRPARFLLPRSPPTRLSRGSWC